MSAADAAAPTAAERFWEQRRAEAVTLTQRGTFDVWPSLGALIRNYIGGTRGTTPASPVDLAIAALEDIAEHAANLGAAIVFQNEDKRVDDAARDALGALAMGIENRCIAARDLVQRIAEVEAFAREARP